MQNQACDVKTRDILPKMAFRDWIDKERKYEIIPKNSFNAAHHCSGHRYYRFHKDNDATRSIPNVLFYYLDRCVRHTPWNNCLVLAAKQEEIASTYEYDRSKESDEKVRGDYRCR